MSTPVLVAIVGACVIGVAVVTALLILRARRNRRKVKTLSPGHSGVFRGVSTATAMEQSSVFLQNSHATTATTSSQSVDMQTIRMPRQQERGSAAASDRVTIDIANSSGLAAPPSETPATSYRAPSMVSGRSVFSASLLLCGGLRNSLPSLSLFRASSRTSQQRNTSTRQDFHATTIGSYAGTATAPLSTLDLQRQTEGVAWRDHSDTCWSIGPDEDDSDTDLESGERFPRTIVNGVEADHVPPRGRLSTVSDDTNSTTESTPRRARRGFSPLNDLTPRRARGISELDDSSPRRIRTLSALRRARGSSSAIDIDTNVSNFSADSDYYDESIKDCSSVLFDSDSDDDGGDDHDKHALEHEL